MNNLTLQQQLKEINQSTIHNIRFLLESYSEEVLEAIDEHVLSLERRNKESLEEIKKEVKTVIRTLKGIEAVITHHKEINI